MTNPNLTHLYFLLDRSGSMHSIRKETIGGYNAFMDEQREQEGDCRVTLAQFDNEYEVVYSGLPIADVPGLVLEPRGATALLDAIGRLVGDAGARLAALPEDQRPGTVIVGIMTDGHENASCEWTHPAIKALVEHQTKTYSWEFLYMGADQDAVEVGTGLGVQAHRSITYARGASDAAMAATSAMVGRVRSASARGEAPASVGYTDAERLASMPYPGPERRAPMPDPGGQDAAAGSRTPRSSRRRRSR